MRREMLAVFVSIVSASTADLVGEEMPARSRPKPVVRSETYAIVSPYGIPVVRAELGHFAVPESRESGSSRQIELAFVRMASTARRPGSPIVWLAGGPGWAGTSDLESPLLRLLLDLRESGDVVVLDQRGTGLSVPRLDCQGLIRFPLDVPLDRARSLDALEQSARACAEHWRQEGVNLAAFNTRESAEDLEDLRLALGAEKLRLLAGSYGTHLALAAIRAHGDRIERAVLAGVVGPDHLRRSPAGFEDQLAEIAMLVRRDPAVAERVPDLIALVREIRDRLETRPVTVQVPAADSSTVSVVVGRFDLAWYTRTMLTNRDSIARIPAFYAAMADGDFSELGRAAAVWRLVASPPATMFTNRCASGASQERVSRIARDRARATFPDSADLAEDRICRAWGVPALPDEFRTPVRSAVPVLFVSGTLDGDAPEENAAEVLAGFSRGRRLIVGGGAHALLGLEGPVARDGAVRFLEGSSPKRERVDLPRVAFERPQSNPASAVLAGRREMSIPTLFGGAP